MLSRAQWHATRKLSTACRDCSPTGRGRERIATKDILVKLLSELEIRHEPLDLKAPSGAVFHGILAHHGEWKLVLHPQRTHLLVTLEIPVGTDVHELLAKVPVENREKFYTSIRRELLDGRTGFNWIPVTNTRDDPRLILLEQKVALTVGNQDAAQRLLDAFQEIVTIAARVTMLFRLTFIGLANAQQTETAKRSGSALVDSMYH